jgi:hypothetical protein
VGPKALPKKTFSNVIMGVRGINNFIFELSLVPKKLA